MHTRALHLLKSAVLTLNAHLRAEVVTVSNDTFALSILQPTSPRIVAQK